MAIKEVYKEGFYYSSADDTNTAVPAILDAVQGESQMANPATDVVWDAGMGAAKFFMDFEAPTQTGSTIAGRTEHTSRYPAIMEAEEMWFSASYYFPVGEAVDPEDEILYQWHVGAVTGSPNFAIRRKNGRFVAYLWIASGFENQMAFDIGPATNGVRHDFVVYLFMHPTDGSLTIWKDGMLARCHNPLTGAPWSVPTSPPGGGITNDYTAYPALGAIQQEDAGISLLVWNGKTTRGTYPNPTKYPKWGMYKSIWGTRYNPDKSIKPEAYDPLSPLYVAPEFREKTIYISNVKFETRVIEFSHTEIFRSLDINGFSPIETPNWWVDLEGQPFKQIYKEGFTYDASLMTSDTPNPRLTSDLIGGTGDLPNYPPPIELSDHASFDTTVKRLPSDSGSAKFTAVLEKMWRNSAQNYYTNRQQHSTYHDLLRQEEIWTSFSIRVPEGYTGDSAEEVVYNFGGAGGGAMSLRINQGRFWLSVSRGDENTSTNRLVMCLDPVISGENGWNDFVMYVKFSAITSEGRLTLWRNGKLMRLYNPRTFEPWQVPTETTSGVQAQYTAFPTKGFFNTKVTESGSTVDALDWKGFTFGGDFSVGIDHRWRTGIYKSGWNSNYNTTTGEILPGTYIEGDPLFIPLNLRTSVLWFANVKWQPVDTPMGDFSNREIFAMLDVEGSDPIELPDWFEPEPPASGYFTVKIKAKLV